MKNLLLTVLSLSLSFLVLLCGTATATITQVQTAHATVPGSSTTSISLTLTLTSGNAVIVHALWFYDTTATISVSDNHGDVFTTVGTVESVPANAKIRQLYCLNVVGGSTTVTLTANQDEYLTLFVSEFSGIEGALDRAVWQGQEVTASPSSGVTTTTQANEILIGGVISDTSAQTFTAGPGFIIPTNGTNAGGGEPGAVEYKVVSATGTYAATFTLGTTTNTATILGTYTAAPLSPSVSTTSPIPATLFGVHINAIFSQPWPSVSVGAEGKGTAITWSYIEPNAPVGGVHSYNWVALDQYVNKGIANGVDIFYSNDSVPRWAVQSQYNNSSNCESTTKCNAMVADITNWDAFVTALVTRYKGKMHYELWNEPSLYDFDIGATPQTNYSDMVTLCNHMHNIVRSIDPAAKIITPSGIGNAYMDNLFANGLTTDVDVVSFHHYSDSTPPNTAENVLSAIAAIETLAANHGLSSKPIWNTEGGWGYDSNLSASSDQMAHIARWYLLHWSNGVKRVYWYQWDNTTFGTLWDPTSGLHPAGTAYQQVYNWMVGATMPNPCTQSGTVWSCTLTRSGSQGLAVWNTAGSSSFAVPTGYTQYRDLSGNTTQLSGSTVTIGMKPILLENLTITTPTTPYPPTNLRVISVQ